MELRSIRSIGKIDFLARGCNHADWMTIAKKHDLELGMSDESSAIDKIQHPELRRLTSGNTNKRFSVIIELDLPQKKVVAKKIDRGGITVSIPTRVKPETPEELSAAEQQISEIRTFLEDLLETSPRWLRSAHSFVARATPKQLRLIAENPTIKAIWPNRELRSFSRIAQNGAR
jgi:hypothetical protein